MNFKGTSGNDNLSGTSGDDAFNMSQGGDDTVSGGGGNDVFNFGAAFTSADQVDGGDGTDAVVLKGNYGPTYLALSGTNLTSVESLVLYAGFSYDLSLADSAIAAGSTLTVNGSKLGVNDHFSVIDSSETDGTLIVSGGAGNDITYAGKFNNVINGGDGDDTIELYGGTNVVQGGAGTDFIYLNAPISASSKIDGGTGNNELLIGYDTTPSGLTLTNHLLKDIDTVIVDASTNNILATVDSAVAAGQTLYVYGNSMTSGHWLHFNGVRETDGNFYLQGGDANDVLEGGKGNDGFEGRGGSDRMTGGAGNNTYYYDAVSDSTGKTHDVITDFNPAHDKLSIVITAVDTTVTTGALDAGAHFDSELTAAIGAAKLAAGDAVLFKPDSGNLAGHTFVVVDANGVAGYQAGQDYVIQVDGVNALTVDNFVT